MSFIIVSAEVVTVAVVIQAIAATLAVISVGMSIYSMLTAKSPKPPVPAPNAISGIPTAEQGKPIPVIFGTCTVSQANVVWWGNPHTVKNSIKMS